MEARNSSSASALPFNSHIDLGQIISLLSFGFFFCGDNVGQMFPVGLSDPESEDPFKVSKLLNEQIFVFRTLDVLSV